MTASTQAPPDTSSRLVLAADRVVTATGAELAPGWLEITCGKVAAVGAGRPASGGTEPVSGTIVPGFVDMHAHGALGHDFVSADDDGIHAIRQHHARRGTTTLMATVATAPIETMLERVRFLRPYVAAGSWPASTSKARTSHPSGGAPMTRACSATPTPRRSASCWRRRRARYGW